MTDNAIALPSKPRIVREEDTTGSYEIDGLYPGYGHTLGNSLRRIILSSLPGTAITHVTIKGVSHEFSNIEGVKEDVITILLNLKRLRLRLLTDEPQILTISAKGPTTITGANVQAGGQVEILNPECHIADVTGKTSLSIECTAARGMGYVPKEEHQKERADIGSIPLDAVFSPIRRVNYEVENMRVGDRTDFNRLRIFIETDGTIAPRAALEQAIETMIHQLKAIIGFKDDAVEEDLPSIDRVVTTKKSGKQETEKEALKMRIEELDLSPRVAASLDEAGIRTIGGLARKRAEDMLALSGLGQKGLQEIKKALSQHGITFKN